MPVSKDDLGPEIIVEVRRHDIGLEGYLVIDNTRRGPGKGGIRMHRDVSRDEVKQLARAMSLKTALAELPFGGAKAGIVWDHTDNKRALFEAFIEEIKYYMPDKYIAAPDVRTGEEEMGWLLNITGDSASTTGKPKDRGGLEYKSPATGYGVMVATKTAAEYASINTSGATLIVDGYGTVGGWAARYLEEQGARLIATSSRHGAIYDQNGLDMDELDRLKARSTPITEYVDAKKLSHDAMLQLPTDIIVTASISNIIHQENYKHIQAKLIIEGSNLPMTHAIEEQLHARNIIVVPDIVANAGGVIASYVEHAENDRSEASTKKIISARISHMTRHVLETSKQHYESPRAAALELAEERLRS